MDKILSLFFMNPAKATYSIFVASHTSGSCSLLNNFAQIINLFCAKHNYPNPLFYTQAYRTAV